jgi:hypothetical protein
MKEEVRLTSVKIKEGLRKDFKKTCLETDINLQKLVNRSIYLYVNDENFRKKVNKVNVLGRNL